MALEDWLAISVGHGEICEEGEYELMAAKVGHGYRISRRGSDVILKLLNLSFSVRFVFGINAIDCLKGCIGEHWRLTERFFAFPALAE